jgi:hypothetical protein
MAIVCSRNRFREHTNLGGQAVIKIECSIVALLPLYCRFTAALPVDSRVSLGFDAEPLSHSHRDCRIRRSGGAQ